MLNLVKAGPFRRLKTYKNAPKYSNSNNNSKPSKKKNNHQQTENKSSKPNTKKIKSRIKKKNQTNIQSVYDRSNNTPNTKKVKKIINTKLKSGSKKLKPSKTVKLGPCIFPFKYKGETYNECYKGSHGEWCATKVDSKGKMKTYAFCDYDSPKVKAKTSSPKLN